MDGRELKQFLRFKDEAYALRIENQHLRLELNACWPELHRAGQRLEALERDHARLVKGRRKAAVTFFKRFSGTDSPSKADWF